MRMNMSMSKESSILWCDPSMWLSSFAARNCRASYARYCQVIVNIIHSFIWLAIEDGHISMLYRGNGSLYGPGVCYLQGLISFTAQGMYRQIGEILLELSTSQASRRILGSFRYLWRSEVLSAHSRSEHLWCPFHTTLLASQGHIKRCQLSVLSVFIDPWRFRVVLISLVVFYMNEPSHYLISP